ncbi:hypothetical protein JMJ77_0009209, partial [Colletotrichum scovillei]
MLTRQFILSPKPSTPILPSFFCSSKDHHPGTDSGSEDQKRRLENFLGGKAAPRA